MEMISSEARRKQLRGCSFSAVYEIGNANLEWNVRCRVLGQGSETGRKSKSSSAKWGRESKSSSCNRGEETYLDRAAARRGLRVIIPDKSRYEFMSAKIEIQLAKVEPIQWTSLVVVPQRVNLPSALPPSFYFIRLIASASHRPNAHRSRFSSSFLLPFTFANS
ncbi:HSP20-like chaperone [Corchorus capsularis]|uniref:HSP20-like chaperone n=1 Tax=Corchorus capsularis TaxID=210143 RepID=A0A1R3FUH2_COCAP|nr:HSP20-like chaperone [Corchorus capsularis]